MRYLTAAITLILVAALAVGAAAQEGVGPSAAIKDQNEWQAEGNVIDLVVEQRDVGSPSLVFFELRSGKNRPILCIVSGDMAAALYSYWLRHKDCKCHCRIGIIGRLRVTSGRTYIKIREWGPAPPPRLFR